MLLAIETSCDETSVALFNSSKYLNEDHSLKDSILDHIIYSQIKMHQAYGGVVPELAAREHMITLPSLCSKILEDNKIGFSDLSSVSVTTGPGLKGCLLVGLSMAKGLATARGIKLTQVNHLEAHVLSFLLEKEHVEFPVLVLLVSGGHTELVLVNNIGEYDVLARTTDDAAGEAFDKIGVLLGMPYPGGRLLSESARMVQEESEISYPLGVKTEMDKFSFSGLKTSVYRDIENRGGSAVVSKDSELVSRISHAAEKAIVLSLVDKLTHWVQLKKPKTLSVVGGVAANSELRSRVEKLGLDLGIEVVIPGHEYCTDNAAMIGATSLLRQKYNVKDSNLEITARARWPISEIS